mmetsp:Transcript_19384/g.50011  ORF Transcript_19384/g.50011 Transcript_19384/m.50011 type:complete len:217 (-) Transcript_19384:448-1098(-)
MWSCGLPVRVSTFERKGLHAPAFLSRWHVYEVRSAEATTPPPGAACVFDLSSSPSDALISPAHSSLLRKDSMSQKGGFSCSSLAVEPNARTCSGSRCFDCSATLAASAPSAADGSLRRLGCPSVRENCRIHTCETNLVSTAGSAQWIALVSSSESMNAGKKTSAVPALGLMRRLSLRKYVHPPTSTSFRYTSTVHTRCPPFLQKAAPDSVCGSIPS